MDDITDINMYQELGNPEEMLSSIEKLLNHFESHEQQEEKSIGDYKKFLGSVRDPATRFLMQMIISDEEKHRAVTHAMATTLKGSLNWSKPAGSLEGPADDERVKLQLQGVTERFIELEKSGIKEYKMLLKEAKGYYHGLFITLIETMIRDSEKHIELLEFLQKRFKA